jgi:hypothetical protein
MKCFVRIAVLLLAAHVVNEAKFVDTGLFK